MRSGCAGHARSMFARRASARAWARRACAGGARRASARARATSQRARRTSIRKAGMPHTLLAALFTSRLCENSNLVRIFQKKNCFSLKKTTVDRDTGSHKVRQSDSLSDRDSGWPDSGSESLGRLPPPGPGPRPSRPRRCWRDGIQKVRSHKVTKKKATGARKRIWRCSTPWKLYVPEVNCTSGALAPAFVMEHALCVSNMHLIARDMQFCSPTCMFCVEHAL